MRIAFVLGSLDVGGTETQVCRLAAELRTAGHEVIVLVLTTDGPLAAVLEEAGVARRAFGYSGLRFRDSRRRLRPWVVLVELSKLRHLYRALRAFRPEVCHAFLYWSYVIALPLAWLARVPVRVSGRRGLTSPRSYNLFYRTIGRASNRFAHTITANANAIADDVVLHERVASNRIRVIRNGVDIPADVSPVGRQPAEGLIVANFIPYKGYADLVRALHLLDRPPVVRAVGEGPQRASLEVAVRAAGLGAVLHFEGHVPDARRLWGTVQFGILASHEEGLPNAVLEAMAAGVPMVATVVGGVPELLEDGVTGLLVPPGDPDQLAAAIERIAGDPELRKRMGGAARARAAAYSWERCVGEYMALYRELSARD